MCGEGNTMKKLLATFILLVILLTVSPTMQASSELLHCEKDSIISTAVLLESGDYCVFIKNNSEIVIDELQAIIYYYDSEGQIVDYYSDGHDVILPGSTVVSKINGSKSYANASLDINYETGINRGYKNHSKDVSIHATQGNNGLIVYVKNNGDVDIDEIEYNFVFYYEGKIISMGSPNDVYDVKAGSVVLEKERLPKQYDAYEIYLNQAHTFDF